MTGKEQYYGLDEIGFVGTQNKTESQVKRDIKRTIQFIKDEKSGTKNPSSRRVKQVLKSK